MNTENDLQPKPAEVSDEEIRDALEAEFLGEPGNRNLADDLRVARAILALRPAQQATPEPCKSFGELYERNRAGVDAELAAMASEATPEPVGEPYGTVTVVRRPGCQDMHYFYRWPEPPYLDNAAEHHQVYTHPTPAPQQVPMPGPVQRLCRYAGQTMRTARNPNITAREAIEIGDYLAAIGITAQAKGGE